MVTRQASMYNRAGKKMIIVGLASIMILFMMYARYQESELLTPDAIESIQRIAYGFYIALPASLGVIACGMYRYHKELVSRDKNDSITVLAKATWNRQSRRIFLIVSISYGVFFSLVSGTLIYQPEVSFTEHYGAAIPSGFVAPCCDSPGYMPKIIVYLTEHVGLQIIPINLILQILVSYLVGLNAAIAVNAYSHSKRGGGLGTVGASTGLFVACPTCAGAFSSVFIGTASGIALTIALTELQTVFIALSIPILLATPFIMAKKLRDAGSSNACPAP